MRKAIVITEHSKYSQILRYNSYPMLVISKKALVSESDNRFNDYIKRVSFIAADPSQYLDADSSEEKEHDISHVVEYLYSKGFDEIVILSDVKNNYGANFLDCLRILQKYHYLKISYESEYETIQYFNEGTHVIPKELSESMTIVPYLSAVISLDYTIDKVTHLLLNEETGPLKDIKLFQRISLLTVEKGAVLVIRKLGGKDEN